MPSKDKSVEKPGILSGASCEMTHCGQGHSWADDAGFYKEAG